MTCFREHLLNRNYDPALYVNQTIDDENHLLTVHLYNDDGKFIGYQRYNPNGVKKNNTPDDAKYSTYTMKGEKAIWGLETLDFRKGELFVVEGLFKASALHRLGLNAVSIMGNNAKTHKEFLLDTNLHLIAICDYDMAGIQMGIGVEAIDGEAWILDKDVDEYTTIELQSLMISRGIL